ncbi:uncharacterized protein LOC135810034 [Sycon ciliatum]|uniref:uncharacterized protein LOC135810034 n=1 Tax=Sycon ciliatum TaxID=27933 RepID=UPI0031F6315C
MAERSSSSSSNFAKGIHSVVVTGGSKDADPTRTDIARNAFMMAGACSAFSGVVNKIGGPFGATVIKDNQIVSCSHNTVFRDHNPTRHGEMCAIRQACANLRSADLSGCDMYTTCEPCPMCWGAIQRSGIRDMYIGVDRYLAAEFSFSDKAYYDEIALLHNALNSKEQAQPVVSNFLTVRVGNPLKALVQDQLLGGDSTTSGDGGDSAWLTVLQADTTQDGSPQAKRSPSIADQRISAEQHAEFSEQLVSYAREMIAKHGSGAQPDGHEACILVDTQTGGVVGRGSALTAGHEDASGGFVTAAVEQATSEFKTQFLTECIAYCTVEPDPMNFCSLLWAKVPFLYIGLPQGDVDAYRNRTPGSQDGERTHRIFEKFFKREERKKQEQPGAVDRVVLRDECADLFRLFENVGGFGQLF